MKNIMGDKNPNWKGGRRIDKSGYILIYAPDHPYRDGDSYVREHRLVMEQFMKRFLSPVEVVHHVNGIKDDNGIENLRLYENESEHSKHEHEMGTYDFLTKYPNFVCRCSSKKHYSKGLCKKCYSREYTKDYRKIYYKRNREKLSTYARDYYRRNYAKKS